MPAEKPKPRGHINTPERFGEAREALGLDKTALAELLRLGPTGRQTIRRIERHGESVPGPYQLAMEALLAGWRPRGNRGLVKLPCDKEPTDEE
jgi:hypothetical protein